MTRVVLVRHAETVWHAENRYAGSTDVELTKHGREQAAALARWADSAGVEKLYVSPMVRATATMQPVAETLSLSATVDPRLRELDFGLGEGLTSTEMAARIPEEYAAFQRDPVRHHLPGGEDPRDAVTRGREAIEELARDAAASPELRSGRILVVTHNTLIRLLLCDALGIDLSLYRKIFPQLDNVALTEFGFRFTPGSLSSTVSLLRFNVPLHDIYA